MADPRRTRKPPSSSTWRFFHNRMRRHSSLEMRTPIEFEKMHTYPPAVVIVVPLAVVVASRFARS
jgi:hypothetical protein